MSPSATSPSSLLTGLSSCPLADAKLSLFFGYNSIYPTGASGEPLSEWPTEVLDYENYPAPNDVYGKLFFYLRDMLVEFQRRCQKLHIEIRLSGVSMKPFERWQTMVMPQRRFDRIEVRHLLSPSLVPTKTRPALARRRERTRGLTDWGWGDCLSGATMAVCLSRLASIGMITHWLP